MKLFLSLEFSQDNQQLLTLIKKHEEFELVDLTETDQKVTVITNGPLTELSNLLLQNYKLADRIEKILLVGGSDAYGDVTMVAEKNIYADPKSAQHVFLSGIPIVWFALNTTRDLDNRALAPLVYLLNPEVFDCEECGVFVETQSEIAMGQTVTDIYSDKQFDHHYALLVKAIDHDAYGAVLESL